MKYLILFIIFSFSFPTNAKTFNYRCDGFNLVVQEFESGNTVSSIRPLSGVWNSKYTKDKFGDDELDMFNIEDGRIAVFKVNYQIHALVLIIYENLQMYELKRSKHALVCRE